MQLLIRRNIGMSQASARRRVRLPHTAVRRLPRGLCAMEWCGDLTTRHTACRVCYTRDSLGRPIGEPRALDQKAESRCGDTGLFSAGNHENNISKPQTYRDNSIYFVIKLQIWTGYRSYLQAELGINRINLISIIEKFRLIC